MNRRIVGALSGVVLASALVLTGCAQPGCTERDDIASAEGECDD